ncbi:hypothetical protein BDB01DRAFT_842815 [Pilobolus umbonatus]|nr:hypothetical protein BDB01DRAFT_842815 [Pilobolus umbonatus]
MYKGTYEDLSQVDPTTPSMSASNSSLTSQDVHMIPGKPMDFDELDNSEGPSRKTEAYYYNSTESDGMSDSEDEYTETFTFAKNISDPKAVLMRMPCIGTSVIDYLRIIGNETNTECFLIGRQVKIVGANEDLVKEALQRFRNLQTIFKRAKKPTTIVPCVHLNRESSEYGLYFCSLNRYNRNTFVDLFNEQTTMPLFVILPVFRDNQGKYMKPQGLLDIPVASPSTQWVQPQQQRMQQEQSLEERMRMASLQFENRGYATRQGQAPDNIPLWGENRNNYIVRTNTPVQRTPSPHTSAPISPVEEFPSLSSNAPPRPTIARRGNPKRVMRITGQQAGSKQKGGSKEKKSSAPSFCHASLQYNLHNMMTSLEEGLKDVSGFKGVIKLNAKLGKVLWTHVTPELQKRIWSPQDINDVAMKDCGIKPVFNNITTKSEAIVLQLDEILPPSCSKSAYFEIHGVARNQPSMPYEPIVMYMNQGVVELKKVVVSTKTMIEINWVALERVFDFQITLKTEETTRMDVKPYSTFIKKVSVSPHTRQITYENVQDFLEVSHIFLKQTTKYRIHFPFVVEITRIEKLPLIPQASLGYSEKILGDTGKGEVWYDVEISYSLHEGIFKSNLDLPAGKLASWTVQDILGSEEDKSNALSEYVEALLLLIDRCDKAMK